MDLLQETFSDIHPQSELAVSLLCSYVVLCLSAQLPFYTEVSVSMCSFFTLPQPLDSNFLKGLGWFHSSSDISV